MGTATYFVLNASVFALILAIYWRWIPKQWRTIKIIGLHLLLLTAVFDGVIIALGIVGYDQTKISGVFIGPSPIEDFFYSLAAIFLVPALWKLCNKKGVTHEKTDTTL